MEDTPKPQLNILRRTANTIVDVIHRYEQTQATTKIGIALIAVGLLSGGLQLALGDPIAAGFCCNTISLVGTASLGVSAFRNRANKK